MIYLKLFWSFLQIGLFSIGGGYAALPLLKQQTVEINKWLTMEDFANLVTISEMTPGPIAINASTFVGTQVAGVGGAIAATLGNVTPSFIIVLTLAFFYYKYKGLTVVQSVLAGLRPAVVALIASAGISILISSLWGENGISINFNVVSVCIFAVALFVLRKFKPNPIYVMLISGVLGLIVYIVLDFAGLQPFLCLLRNGFCSENFGLISHFYNIIKRFIKRF